jgi:hypothetical protein
VCSSDLEQRVGRTHFSLGDENSSLLDDQRGRDDDGPHLIPRRDSGRPSLPGKERDLPPGSSP